MAARGIVAALLGAVLLISGSAWAGPIGESGPVGRVRAVYARIQGGAAPEESDLDLLRKLAAPGLRALIDRELACRAERGGPCRLGFSVLAGDAERRVTHADVALTRSAPDSAEVTADFRNAGRPRTVKFRFAWDGGRWRLTDVRSGDAPAWSLTELLERGNGASTPSGASGASGSSEGSGASGSSSEASSGSARP